MPKIKPGYMQDNYVFVGFEHSKRKNKKYDAILFNADTGRYKRIPFGDSRYQQYKDSTGLGKYSHLDHNDNSRRKSYRERHKHTYSKTLSPSYFAYYYLW